MLRVRLEAPSHDDSMPLVEIAVKVRSGEVVRQFEFYAARAARFAFVPPKRPNA
jgi:hypothetical protein